MHRGSLPPRGAWIEMKMIGARPGWGVASLPPRGAWIEMAPPSAILILSFSRSPHGERGLKWQSNSQHY